MLYIGIDLGTSAVKLLLMEETGAVLRTLQREYPVSFPHSGWSEQNPQDWWEQTCAGVQVLLNGFDPRQVRGVSFGGQMHGLVALDAQDNVIRPAILWNDGRAAQETDFLNQEVGKERLAQLTGNIAFAGFTAPKLIWMRKHEPERFARIRRIMLPKDYLAYRMTGVHSTDYSDAAGTLLLDTARKRWSPEMLELCGLRPEQVPQLYESWEVVGTLLPEAAAALGLPTSVKVCAGAGDNAAAAVGTGTLADGSCNLSLGTSGTLFLACDSFLLPQNHALHAFAHATGRFHLMGCMLSAAACNQWWMGSVLGTEDYMGEQAGFAPLGENTILFAPYLMGERTPHNDPAVRGAFVGLSLDTSRAQMTQAILEGVAYGFRDSLEIARSLGLKVARSTLCGGGAKSPVWREILANVLRLPIDRVETEGPSMGAAMLAAVGCGDASSLENLSQKTVHVADTVLPRPEIADRYDEGYRRFRALYPALRTLV